MGARPEDYAVSAPYKSYIHVDDFDGPKELADYLHKLDQDDQEYNEYFKWKVRKLFMFKIILRKTYLILWRSIPYFSDLICHTVGQIPKKCKET